MNEAKKRILVMDDEDLILNIAGKMIEKLGYIADSAKNGEEAIELYKASIEDNNTYDLVILDLTVSCGMGADEAIKSLLEIDPDVNAVISTGFSTDPMAMNYGDYGFKGSISKPYGLSELKNSLEKYL